MDSRPSEPPSDENGAITAPPGERGVWALTDAL